MFTSKTLTASAVVTALLTCFTVPAFADAILVPNPATGEVLVFDPTNGTHLGGFEIDPALVSRPMNIVDGFDGSLLVSDWEGVRMLDPQGRYLANLSRGPLADLQCCGMTVVGNKLVVATTVDTRPLDRAGGSSR